MEYKYKIVALDLDGTLLRSDKTISEETYRVLEAVSKLGVQIVPCTGRLYGGMPKCIIDLPFVNYAICGNGSIVYDVKNDKNLCDIALPCEKGLEIIDKIKDRDMIYEVYINNKAYMECSQFEKADNHKYIANPFYIQHTKEYVIPINDIYGFIKNNHYSVQKFLFMKNDPSEILDLVHFIENNIKDCVTTSSATNDAETNHPDATKGNGLKFLANYLGYSLDETIAFGDGGNDVSMLKIAGLGIVPANGRTMAKEVADMETLSCDEDGVAFALKRLFFNENLA